MNHHLWVLPNCLDPGQRISLFALPAKGAVSARTGPAIGSRLARWPAQVQHGVKQSHRKHALARVVVQPDDQEPRRNGVPARTAPDSQRLNCKRPKPCNGPRTYRMGARRKPQVESYELSQLDTMRFRSAGLEPGSPEFQPRPRRRFLQAIDVAPTACATDDRHSP